MENKTSSLWNESREPRELRPPNTSSSNRLKNDDSNPPSLGQQVKPPQEIKTVNSRLSATAPEFYPPNYIEPSSAPNRYPTGGSSHGTGIQNRLKKHKIAETEPFECEFIDSPDDNRLKHLIVTLTKDPGQFSDLLDIFMDTLCPYYEDILVLSRAAQLLVLQAIECPSFRYTGARLCCAIEQYCPNFRAELHLTCQKELKNHSNKSGLLLFVAELYTQLHHENIYGNYLIDAYKHLLATGGNENVKCICQALKLTGYSLELYNKQAMDEVFVKLNLVSSSVTGTAASLINSVINLRSSNWGHSTSDPGTNHESENTYWGDVPNTVFYSADGSRFTSEESDFLAAHMNYTEEFEAELSDPDELCDPEPEMDEEIQAAFKDFVKLSKR